MLGARRSQWGHAEKKRITALKHRAAEAKLLRSIGLSRLGDLDDSNLKKRIAEEKRIRWSKMHEELKQRWVKL